MSIDPVALALAIVAVFGPLFWYFERRYDRRDAEMSELRASLLGFATFACMLLFGGAGCYIFAFAVQGACVPR